MSLNVKKLFAMKRPCKDCPFLKNNPIPLVEGRIDDIKSTLLANDNIPFFAIKQHTLPVLSMTMRRASINLQGRKHIAWGLWHTFTQNKELMCRCG